MTKKAYDKIAAGLEDAIAYIKGDKSRGVTHTPGDVNQVPTPPQRMAAPKSAAPAPTRARPQTS